MSDIMYFPSIPEDEASHATECGLRKSLLHLF